MEKKQRNIKTKLILLQISSFLVSVLPLIIFVVVNWGNYVKTTSDAVKLSVGMVIAIVLFVLKAIGKLKMPRRVVFYAVTCILCYFLYPLIKDIVWLSALCLVGELLDMFIFQRPIKNLKEKILIEKTSDATTEKVKTEVKALFDEYIGGGRA